VPPSWGDRVPRGQSPTTSDPGRVVTVARPVEKLKDHSGNGPDTAVNSMFQALRFLNVAAIFAPEVASYGA
jgi:hypothetical protein